MLGLFLEHEHSRRVRQESRMAQTFKAKGHMGALRAKRKADRPVQTLVSCEAASREAPPGGRGKDAASFRTGIPEELLEMQIPEPQSRSLNSWVWTRVQEYEFLISYPLTQPVYDCSSLCPMCKAWKAV